MRSDIEGLTKRLPDFAQKKRIFYHFAGIDASVMKLLGAKSESIPIASPDQHKIAVDWSLKTVFNPPGSCQIFKKHGFSFSH